MSLSLLDLKKNLCICENTILRLPVNDVGGSRLEL